MSKVKCKVYVSVYEAECTQPARPVPPAQTGWAGSSPALSSCHLSPSIRWNPCGLTRESVSRRRLLGPLRNILLLNPGILFCVFCRNGTISLTVSTASLTDYQMTKSSTEHLWRRKEEEQEENVSRGQKEAQYTKHKYTHFRCYQ